MLTPQDLDNCIKLRKAQVDKIEATYTYLKEHSSGSNDSKLVDENPPDCCLNQDLIKLTDGIKQHKEENLDYEMVIVHSMLLALFAFSMLM